MSKMGYNSTDKNLFERKHLVTCSSKTEYCLKKKTTKVQCTKQPQFAAPAISPVTHECSISAKLHYVAGTTLAEVSNPALTCVLQLYERVSTSATNFPMQGKTGILIAFSRVREKLFLNNKFMAASNYSLQYGFLLHRICVDSYIGGKSSMET